MKLRIRTAGLTLTAQLDDSRAAREFAALLPLERVLTDFNCTEKVADLPARLSTGHAPVGMRPAAGDLTYYAPWGNLAIFYRDFDYSRGLVHLGRIDGDIERLARPGSIRVRIEIDESQESPPLSENANARSTP